MKHRTSDAEFTSAPMQPKWEAGGLESTTIASLEGLEYATLPSLFIILMWELYNQQPGMSEWRNQPIPTTT